MNPVLHTGQRRESNPVFLLAAQQTVIPDLNKPLWQNMQTKTAQEFITAKGYPSCETNRKIIEEKEHLYKRCQSIVEHPFGQ